jgi:hypothetical protein
VGSATPSAGSCAGNDPVVCTFGTIEAGNYEIVEIALAAPPIGQYTLSSVSATTAFDGFAANNNDAVEAGVVGVGMEDGSGLPRELTLSNARPNPSRGPVTITWGLPQPGPADVRVYDLLGREVARLAEGAPTPAGWHEVHWDAEVASGVYVILLRVGDETRTRRLTILR